MKKTTLHNNFNLVNYLGGPVTLYEKNDERHVLIGTVHGAFASCDNNMPGIFVRIDDNSNLQFLHKEALNSGMYIHRQGRDLYGKAKTGMYHFGDSFTTLVIVNFKRL